MMIPWLSIGLLIAISAATFSAFLALGAWAVVGGLILSVLGVALATRKDCVALSGDAIVLAIGTILPATIHTYGLVPGVGRGGAIVGAITLVLIAIGYATPRLLAWRTRRSLPDIDARTAHLRAQIARVVRDACERHLAASVHAGTAAPDDWDGALILRTVWRKHDGLTVFIRPRCASLHGVAGQAALQRAVTDLARAATTDLGPVQRALWRRWMALHPYWTDTVPRYTAHQRLHLHAYAPPPAPHPSP